MESGTIAQAKVRFYFNRVANLAAATRIVKPTTDYTMRIRLMSKGNLLYAQSGGVTAVINTTACAVIETARQHKKQIGHVFAARNGILGVLREELIDTAAESSKSIAALRHTPGGAFGSCRYKLKSIEENRAQYERLIAVFKAHDIRYFLYNGGNDSADTALKISQIGAALNYPIACIGVPKTVDNDLPVTDCSPGFGSVAKYTAISMREAAGSPRPRAWLRAIPATHRTSSCFRRCRSMRRRSCARSRQRWSVTVIVVSRCPRV